MSDVNIKVGLTSQAFKSGLDKVKGELASWKSQQVSAFATLGKTMAGSFTGLLTVAGFVEFARATIDMAKNLRNSAAEANLTVESFQSLTRVFAKGGTDAEQTTHGLIKLSEHIQEARDGSEKMIASFAKVGVTWQDLHRLTPEQVLAKMADGLREITDPAESTAVAVELLGKAGASMAVTLRKGTDEIDRLRSGMKGLTTEQVGGLKKVGDFMDGLINKSKVFTVQAVGGLLVGAANFGKSIHDKFHPDPEGDAREAAAAAKGKADAAAAAKPVDEGIPVDPATAKELERQATEAMKTTLQGVRTGQGNTDNDLDNIERRRVEARDIAEIERRSADSQLEAEARLAGFTSKRLENSREQALITKQLDDIEGRKAAAETPQQVAGIEAERVEIQAKGNMLAAEHLRLEQQIAHAEREAADVAEEGRIASLELTDREAASQARIALLESQIAANVNESKNADELRTAELNKQNAALENQVQQIKNAKAIADAKKTPQQKAAERAEDRQNRSILRAADAHQASKDLVEKANKAFAGKGADWDARFRKPKLPKQEDLARRIDPPPAPPKVDTGNMELHLDKISTDLGTLVQKSNVA